MKAINIIKVLNMLKVILNFFFKKYKNCSRLKLIDKLTILSFIILGLFSVVFHVFKYIVENY